MSCSSSQPESNLSNPSCGSEKLKKNNSISLDRHMKSAAVRVSPSVVCLVYSRAGHQEESPEFSGTIIECKKATDEHSGGGKYDVTVLTCAGFVTFYGVADLILDVNIYVADGYTCICRGQVTGFDVHYNIAIVKFKSGKPLKTASWRWVDDFIPVNPKHDNTSEAQHQSAPANSVKLWPGDRVMALARRRNGHCLIARSGVFSADSCGMDCQELYMTTCEATPDRIGGPLINCDGEVIGICFFQEGYTPFLPMNIVSRCLACLLEDRHVNRPFFGMRLTSFYAADLATLEKISQKFPDVCGGVLVRKVKKNSPAYAAGICCNDVITRCDGNPVFCTSDFFGKMWDECGNTVQLQVVRVSLGDLETPLISNHGWR